MTISKWMQRLDSDETAATTVEYAVMIALIIGVCVAAVQTLATATQDSFNASGNAIEEAL